jgi:hypothetical protein
MKVELEGPADGVREDVPDDISEIFLTDVGPARAGFDPFGSRSLGRMMYKVTDRKTIDGAIIFRYAGSVPVESAEAERVRRRQSSDPSGVR